VSTEAECDLLVSEVRTWPGREVTLSALLAGALYLSDVAGAAAESAALTAAHPGAAPLDPVYPLKSVCPSEADPECRALLALSPTPSTAWSSSSSARLLPYPSSYHLPSVREKIEDYRMARDENKHDI
jgi:hypothetical protein